MEALFREFNIVMQNGVYKMDEEEQLYFRLVTDEFKRRLAKGLKGAKLILAIYELVDKLNAQYLSDHKIACHKGCGWCCHQLVCATTLEMQAIADYLNSLERKRRSQICRRVRERASQFYYQNEALLKSRGQWEEVGEILRRKHFGRPCVFLASDLSCDIYPTRPVECRTTRSLDKCGPYTGEKPQLRKVS